MKFCCPKSIKHIKSKLLCISFLLFSALNTVTGLANEPINQVDCIVSQYSIEEGLRQSMVKQILQDSQGFIWMVTGDGLHLFDGKSFKVFRVPKELPFSASDNMMRSISEVSEGCFIIASKTSLLLFNSHLGQFQLLRKVNHPQVFSLKAEGISLALIHEKGIFVVNDTTLHHVSIKILEGKLPNPFIPKKIETLNGKTIILGNEGIIELQGIPTIHTNSLDAIYYPTLFKDLCKTVDGKILVLSSNKIYNYNLNSKTEEIFTTLTANFNVIYSDSKGIIWLSSWDQNAVYQLHNRELYRVKTLTRQGRLVEEINPYSIYFFEDKEHSVWIGTDGQGVLQYQREIPQFLKADIGFVKAITATKSSIWIATFQNGIWRLSFDLKQKKHFGYKTFDNNILDIEIDKYGGIWVATSKNVLLIDTIGTTIFKHPRATLIGNFTKGENGAINYYSDSCHTVFTSSPTPKKISKRTYRHITTSLEINGKQWEGTPFGLFITNSENMPDYELYHPKFRILESDILSMVEHNNLIWVATSNGLAVFDKLQNKIELPGNLEELKSESIYSLETDSKNRLWFSFNNGIGCIPKEMDRIIYFNQKNNLQSLEFNSKASYKTDTMVYFGGISGINAISTNSFEPIQKNFKPRLVSLNVGDKPICEGIPLDSVSTSLQWSNSSISGKVISGSYVGVSDQLFTFTLKNYDRNWSSPVSSAEFSYRNLPSGRYTLLVKCSDTNGFWSEPTVLAQIRVTPPFWRAWWFLINSILVIVLSTIVIVRQSQKRRYLKKIVELEHQNALEKERLRISRDLHDELGTSVSLILLNSSMALSSQKSDIVYNHLNAISKNTKELYDNMNSLIWLMKSENQTLENLLLRIREKMSEVLEEASFQYSISMPDIENELLITREACRQIFLTVKEAVNNAIKHSNGSEVTIEIVLDSSSLVFIITDNGLINNAVEPNKNGNGLNNMRSRTEQLGGIFEFKANTTKGFSVSIKLPINRIAVL